MYLALLSPLPFLPDQPCYNLPTVQWAADLNINTKMTTVGNILAYTYYQQKGKKKIRFFSFGHLLCLSDAERERAVTETQGPSIFSSAWNLPLLGQFAQPQGNSRPDCPPPHGNPVSLMHGRIPSPGTNLNQVLWGSLPKKGQKIKHSKAQGLQEGRSLEIWFNASGTWR